MATSSPFESVHERMGADFSEYHGWRLPRDYGDAAAEGKALEQSSAAFDLSSFGKITVKGSESESLVSKLLGENSEMPGDGKWIWSSAGDTEGAGSAAVRVGKVGESYMIFTYPQERETVFSRAQSLVSQNDLSKAALSDITEKTGMLGIYGPGAISAVGNILPFGISGIEQGDIRTISFFMMSVTLVCGSWLGVAGLELLCPSAACGMAAGAIAKYHEREKITPAGMECFEKALLSFKGVFRG